MLDFGLISYVAAGTGFLLLTVLLLLGWDERAQGGRVIGACAISVLWAAVLALDARPARVPVPALALVEAMRYGAWLLVIDGLAVAAGIARGRLLAYYMLALAVLVAIGVLMLLGTAEDGGVAMRFAAPAGMTLSLLGLALLWELGRGLRAERRGDLQWLLVALGLSFGCDLLLFADARLAGGTGLASDVRGLVGVAVVPMIAVAARHNLHWAPGFFVSRHVVFYGAGIAAVTSYLLMAALGSRLILSHGGTSREFLHLLFIIGAALALLSLLASDNLRQRLRVFVSKNFYRTKYDYRREWLRFIQTLSTTASDTDPYGNAIRAIAQIVASPGGVLFLRREPSAGFVPVCVWPQGHLDITRIAAVAADAPLVRFLERRQWVIDLRELRESPAMYGDIGLPPAFGITSSQRIILPLLHGVRLIGFVVLQDPPTSFDPNYEDRDLLKTVGRHVATHIEQHEMDQRLAESRQFEAYHRLTAFVMHDLKNLAAQLALIVANAERHKRNPEFVDDTIQTVANSTRRMQRLIEQLQGRELAKPLRTVSMADAISRAVEQCRPRLPEPTIDVDRDELLVEADPEQLIAGLEHIIRNAQDATPRDGSVAVVVRGDGTDCLVTVTDSGCGMSPEFVRERLFKPFDTTKGSQGMGIGAYQLREYVQSLGGSVQVTSQPGQGTVFAVRLHKFHS